MFFHFRYVYLLLALIIVPTTSMFSIGILDPNFGTGGKMVTDLGSDISVRRLYQQDDGKIIVLADNSGSIVLLRYGTDGTLDSTFGVGGKIVTGYNSSDTKISFNIQANGQFAVGNNSSVTRYNSSGSIVETVNFPAADFAGFGADGMIATSSLIPANGTCFSQQFKIDYRVYNPDGSANGATEFCSGGSGTTGITSIWGIEPSYTNSFYVGYTHQALNASNGRVREMAGTTMLADLLVDIGQIGYSLVDLAPTRHNGFVSLGYFLLSRQLPVYQFYMLCATGPCVTAEYRRVHADNVIATLKRNSRLLVLNESLGFLGVESISNIFGSASEQSAVYVQTDDKVLIAGQIPSTNGYNNIALVRYSSVIGSAARMSDFDQDLSSDLAVWRPSIGEWYILNSSNGSTTGVPYGTGGDTPASADFDGDGNTDIAVWRPSVGSWYWINSADGTFSGRQFGTSGDLPVPAYYDDDEKADLALYRPQNGTWYVYKTHSNVVLSQRFGIAEDIPTIGDFDGDGLYDIAVWRPSSGIWYRLNTLGGLEAQQFGVTDDVPAAADYDGDGKTDISVFRPSTGVWYRVNSTNGSLGVTYFGISEDKPVPADYDGDGKTDIGVFRPSSGIWYLLGSTAGFSAQQFGVEEDIPIPNALLH